MLLVTTTFEHLARTQARVLGMPQMPAVVLPHPIGGTPLPSVFEKLDAAVDDIVTKLTKPFATGSEHTVSPRSEWLELQINDEWGDLQMQMLQRGWGDGLPLVPPTPERVTAMVAASRMPPDAIIGELAPKMGVATVELVAVNAVMAGCQPKHMPLLIAAVKGLSAPSFYLKNMQATTHPITPLMIVSGPLGETLRVNSGSGLFGPGPWANGAIGRAIRLMLINIGGGMPGEIDKATMGHPGKFSFCIAENEAALPEGWPSLRAERGFSGDVSTVTMFGAEAPHNINDHESTNAAGVLTTVSGCMAQIGQNNVYYPGEVLVVLSPEHAATIATDGLSKDDVKRKLYAQATVPLGRFSKENRERRLWRWLPDRYKDKPLDTPVTVTQHWEDIFVIVAGGAGKHSMYLPSTGSSKCVTNAVLKPDGSPWLPLDFK